MSRQKKSLRGTLQDFLAYYGRRPSRAELAVEREVFGINAGIISYTTPAQADDLVQALGLRRETRLLEIGAGTGWPGVHLAKQSDCEAVLTDVPLSGVHTMVARAVEHAVHERLSCLAASGTHLPFRPHSFDAVVHSDVL
jgi:ubiquinone/menaquinone biosynthesis C-methylase UbiE